MRAILLAVALAPSVARAEWPRTVLAGGADGLSVRAGDLDGDGWIDVVAGSETLDEVIWFRNLGGGAFSGRQILASDAPDPDKIRLADLDGDGDPDLVAVVDDPLVYNGHEIRWYPNVGGALGPPVLVVPALVSTQYVAEAGDLDGDGDADLLVTTEYPGQVRWYANDGSGGFAAPVDIGAPPRTSGAAIADLDGDGAMDVLVSSHTEGEWLYRGLGGGSFAEGVLFADEYAAQLAVADLDGDGDPDVAMGTRYDACWKENLGGGDFGDPLVCGFVENGVASADAIAAADLDGDGDVDLLTGGQARATNWHANDSGSFPVANAVADDLSSDVCAADVTGDGLADAVTVALLGGVALMENAGGAFPTRRVLAGSANTTAVVLFDVDGDGDPDPVTGTDGVAWWENEGGVFGASHPVTREASEPSELEAADVDRDGDLDVVAAVPGGGLRWYPNDAGAFAPGRGMAPGCGTTVRAADLDADGDTDLVCGGDELVTVDNRGGGALLPTTLQSEASFDSVDVADADGDGDPDIVAVFVADEECPYYDPYDDIEDDYTCHSWRSIWWLPNLGGGFGPAIHVVDGDDSPTKVRAADLDGDGVPDLVTASHAGIQWYANAATVFGEAQRVGVQGWDATDVRVADLDADGDPDVVGAFVLHGTTWYRNDGAGGFDAGELVSGPSEISLAVGDLDGDYGPDVVGVDGDRLTWYANPAPGHPPEDTGAPPDTDPPGPEGTGDTGGGGDTDAAPEPNPHTDAPEGGCGCATAAPGSGWLALLGLMAVRVRRRR